MSTEVKVMVGILLATVLFVVGAAVFIGGSQQTEGVVVDQALLIDSTAQVVGSASAKVTLVEFGDYECPSCAAAHPTIKQIIKDYKDDVRFVFRHFPLSMHKYAKIAARAAEAAGKQKKFFEMSDKIFTNQSVWAASSNPQAMFETYAKELGLDVEQFKKDIDSPDVANAIAAGVTDGTTAGVNSTPTFFLDNQEFTGSFSDLRAEIDSRVGKLR